MIAIKRTNKPKILEQKADTWTKSLMNLRAKLNACKKESEVYRKLKHKYQLAENKYQHDSIKAALKSEEMFSGKCAYCESFILHIDYGHIEHYQPKSIFPEYTFDWNNLLLACGVCNGSQFKSNKFPITNEQPMLLNPCSDDPTEHLNFDYDPYTNLASVYGKTPRGEKTEIVMGLNRPELLRYRSQMVKKIIFLGIKTSEGDIEAKKILDEACKSTQAYSAFADAIRNKFKSAKQ